MKMAPESPVIGGFDDDFERDIDALVHEQHHSIAAFNLDVDELNIFRSSSAPPTMMGSRSAFGSLFGHNGFTEPTLRLSGQDSRRLLSEDDLRSHPEYASYYYSNENLNPRMPRPAISKEDWRAQQRFHGGAPSYGGIGDRRKKKESVNGDGQINSIFSLQPGFPLHSGEEILNPRIRLLSQDQPQQPQHHQESGEWLERSSDGLI